MKKGYVGFWIVLLILIPCHLFAMAARPPVVETGDEPREVIILSDEYIMTEVPGQDAIHTSPGDYTITNNGLLFYNAAVLLPGESGNGIEAEGSGNVILNVDGVIVAGQAGILTGDDSMVTNTGMVMSELSNGIETGDDSTIINEGIINAGVDGINAGYNSTVINAEGAEIFSDDTSLNGLPACGIEAGSESDITNDGLIWSHTASGITTYNGSTIDNNGYISALFNGINAGDGNTITNTGYIGGDGATVTYNSVYMEGPDLVLLPVSGGIAVGDDNLITNDGFIYASGTGILGDDGNTIINNGEIYSDMFVAVNTGIHVGDFNYVENNGLIYSATDGGIEVGYNSTVINGLTGVINASSFTAANGIDGQDDNIVENYGEINATGSSIVMLGDLITIPHSHGVHVLSNNLVTNYNTITASTAGIEGFGDNNLIINEAGARIFADDIGISVGRDEIVMVALEEDDLIGNTVINRGTIGDDPYAPSDNLYNSAVVRGIIATGPATITNDGTIHATYAGISTMGDGDTIVNGEDGEIYVYGNDAFIPPPGIMVIGGDAGISVGAPWLIMNPVEPVDENSTPGVGDQQAIADGIINSVTNYGLIDAYDENQWSGAAGIRAGYNALIINAGQIDAYWDGIEAEDYNIVHNTYNGVINSDLGHMAIPGTGIDVDDYNLVTNDGTINSLSSGIYVDDHNEVTNSGLIDAVYDGIYAGDYNIILNTETGVILSDQHEFFQNASGIHVGDNNQVTNAGSITSIVSDGIYAGSNNTILNSGEISATYNMVGVAGIQVFDSDGYDWLDEGVYNTATINTVTNTGEITGEIGVFMDGPGEIINSGYIEGLHGPEGPTAILLDFGGFAPLEDLSPAQLAGYDQYVTLQTGSEVIGDIFDYTSEDNDALTLDGEGQYDFSVYGVEQLFKTGEGTWIVTGYNSSNFEGYVGEFLEADIEEGSLQVDGELGVGVLTVHDGATLAGDGDINSLLFTVFNGGTVAPGPVDCEGVECIGELTINGTFRNYAGMIVGEQTSGNLAIDMIGAQCEEDAANDVLNVWLDDTAVFGDESVDGGTVTPNLLGSLTEGRYTFLYADNLLVYEDPEVVFDSLLLNIDLGYDEDPAEGADSMWLDVTRNEVEDVTGSSNDQSLYDALTELAGDCEGEYCDEAQEVLDLLDQMGDDDDISDALSGLSPEQYPNLLDISVAGFHAYGSSVAGRMGSLHLTQSQSESQYANGLTSSGPALSRIAAFDRKAGGWSGWAKVLGAGGEQDEDSNNVGFEFDTAGISLGFDNRLNDNLVMGVGFGYAESDVDFENLGQSTDVESYHGSLYGTYSTERYYVDGAFLFASNSYDSDRRVNLFDLKAKSDTDGSEWGLYLGAGCHVVETDSMYFIPTVSAQFAEVDIDGFTEKGADPYNLKVSDFDASSVVTTLGFRLGGKFGTFEPELRVGWAHEFGDTERDVRAQFVGTSTGFTIDGVEPDEDSALIGFGFNAYLQEDLTLFADYDGEFRSGYDGYALSAGLRYDF